MVKKFAEDKETEINELKAKFEEEKAELVKEHENKVGDFLLTLGLGFLRKIQKIDYPPNDTVRKCSNEWSCEYMLPINGGRFNFSFSNSKAGVPPNW
jgi:hypothetical protein